MTRFKKPTYILIPVADLARYSDPLTSAPWEGHYEYERATIQSCLDQNLLESLPWDRGENCYQNDLEANDPLYHAKRVAYLVRNKSPHPIDIDVGIPELGFTPCYLIQDGCHRLAAAIFRDDPEIAVEYAGSTKEFKSLFPRRRKPN